MQAPIAPGTLLHDRYRLIGVAGQGKFGQTYLARDQKRLNELCVLKEFTPVNQDAAAVEALRQRFHQAVSELYELQHPQLPRLRVMIAQEQRLYWGRDYIEGKSYGVLLDERKAQGQGFAEAEVIQFLLKVLPVLTYLHNRDVVHRNISLHTLIWRQQDQLPVLINFGLVQELVVRLQLHPVDRREALGQWGYAPPEQFNGKVDATSDLYALAVVAIALLAGDGPEALYNSQTRQLEWESRVKVQPKLAQILRQMLHPQPKKRIASAAQVTQLLEPLLPTATATPVAIGPVASTTAVTAAPATTDQADDPKLRPAQPPRRRVRPKRKGDSDPRASAAMAVGLLMLVAAVAWKVVPHKPPGAKPNAPSVATNSPAPANAPAPDASTAPSTPAPVNSTDQAALRERRRQLNIDFPFFTALVDAAFYSQYPQRRSQPLSDPEQARLQAEWTAIASSTMDKLATLKPETRSKLGHYTRANYDQWLAALGESGAKNSQRLDALADSRFFQLFPDQKGKPLNPRTFGQVWYAIAEEQLSAAKAQPPAVPPPPATGDRPGGNRSL